MPLMRGETIGYDPDLMAFKFTMRNGERIVQCQISTVSTDDSGRSLEDLGAGFAS